MPNRLHKPLVAWYDANKRDLPWRRTSDPYAVWVSEVMLQQTQVATVIPYYDRWMERFPNVRSLAEAGEQEVLAQWQGLGYYRRARYLLEGARYVIEQGIPNDEAGWRKVPGIGKYTAGAIASIAQQQRVPVVDGNVERVFARVEGCELAGGPLHTKAWQWATDNHHPTRPGDWNQALMELGATICRPVNPDCPHCPLRRLCFASLNALQNELPRKEAPPRPVVINEHIWVPVFGGLFGVRQIPEGQWWHGMWEFLREGSTAALEALLPGESPIYSGTLRYQVTNHKITAQVSVVRCVSTSAGLRWESEEGLRTLPVPAPQRKALRMALLRLDTRTLFDSAGSEPPVNSGA